MHTADGEKRAALVYRLGHWERVVGSIRNRDTLEESLCSVRTQKEKMKW